MSLPETRACLDGKFSACTIHGDFIAWDSSDLLSMRAVETLSLPRATYAKHGWRGNLGQPADPRMTITNILTGNEAAWNKEERRLWVRRAAKKRFVHRYQTCLRGMSFIILLHFHRHTGPWVFRLRFVNCGSFCTVYARDENFVNSGIIVMHFFRKLLWNALVWCLPPEDVLSMMSLTVSLASLSEPRATRNILGQLRKRGSQTDNLIEKRKIFLWSSLGTQLILTR